ncbi:MAG: (4Fe-4S)-binding protein [Bacteroidia bacterium]|nr:(4Fe-4S)-binding protein [Bacteroidia bacterium]NND25373.1 (4Fe-4S)-binding protein [Flavobacteriaceae bacterium]MBT8279673.1 (4Fe-4S)-binding protein [Bacteroidia bacterium]NNK59475.1 (4Fe-4S)-binding protein [Flavobacteriaceae bacterium]NNL33973.1 (4Fe-4S)-binding protein [Flavobacteriaceae bacterium]
METHDNVFSNKEITVTFEPCLCIHAEKCAKELSEVFRTTVIPWINLEGSETQRVIDQIKRCPSGALKFHYNQKEAV